MNVSPDELKSSVGEQVVDGGYGSTSEYVRDIDRALDYYLSKADTALPRPESLDRERPTHGIAARPGREMIPLVEEQDSGPWTGSSEAAGGAPGRAARSVQLLGRPACWRLAVATQRGIESPKAGKHSGAQFGTWPPAGGSNLCLVGAPMLSDLRNRRSEILATARARGATHVRVFGSVARGDATETSDIDFLVDLDDGRGLLDLGGLLMDLQELLGHNVDVVTEAGLRDRVARRVLDDAVEL